MTLVRSRIPLDIVSVSVKLEWANKRIIKYESAKLRALRALVPYVRCAPRALVPDVPRALRALVPHVPRALRALVTQVFRTLHVLVPHVLSYPHFFSHIPCSRTLTFNFKIFVRVSWYFMILLNYVSYVLSCPLCLVPYVLSVSRASCPMWPRASHFMSPFSLHALLFCNLRNLCPNITFCALELPSIALLSFLFICYLWFVLGNLLKLKRM